MQWGLRSVERLKSVGARSLFIWTSSQMRKPLKTVVYRGTYTRLWKWPKLKTEAGKVLEEEASFICIFFSYFPGYCLQTRVKWDSA